jgi:SAM-dependent methyltransferase
MIIDMPTPFFVRAGIAMLAAALVPGVFAAGEEAPYIPTSDNVAMAMLTLAKVTSEDYVIDLGSGDGRIVIAAAKRFGARGLGVEIVPELVEKSRQSAASANVSARAVFREQDLFKTDLSPANVVTLYLLPEVNLQLRPRLLQLRPGTRIVSHDWDMGDWEPEKVITLDVPDKPIGREKSSKVFLWIVPARVEGDWCGTGKAKGVGLRLAQSYQRFRGELTDASGVRTFEGRINASVLRGPPGLNMTYDGVSIRATYATGKYSPLKNATFGRQRGPSCK